MLEKVDLFGDIIYPGLEMMYDMALPLIRLSRENKIPVPTMDFSSLKNLSTDIFILAGRWDEAADYRTQIELAKKYKHSTIFIADDDHLFKNLKEAGLLKEIVSTFFYYGSNSLETKKTLKKLDPYKWEGKNKN
jgi:alpha/beta superfamily hydrolase